MRKMIQAFLILFLATAVWCNVAQEDVKFYLTNTKLTNKEVKTDENIDDVDPEHNVKILCHGWLDNNYSYWYSDTVSEYLAKGMTNVITVDWSTHSYGFYSTAVSKTGDIGQYIALFVLSLHDTYGIPLSKFHIIGHSLGAHISAHAGKRVKSLRKDHVGRITGLDPAGPSFEGTAADMRLSTEDAQFVDIIHTDGGYLGCKASIGHIDFFPNGGVRRQNGCGPLDLGCSHLRAPIYFFESINRNNFIAVTCNNLSHFNSGSCANNQKTVMGEDVDQSLRGDFYLNTASSAPYSLG